MPADFSALRCSKCGAAPAPDAQAKEGGTHYRRLEHGAGIPGRRAEVKLRTCGQWRAVPHG